MRYANKIEAIKALRSIVSPLEIVMAVPVGSSTERAVVQSKYLGLKEAKDLVEDIMALGADDDQYSRTNSLAEENARLRHALNGTQDSIADNHRLRAKVARLEDYIRELTAELTKLKNPPSEAVTDINGLPLKAGDQFTVVSIKDSTDRSYRGEIFKAIRVQHPFVWTKNKYSPAFEQNFEIGRFNLMKLLNIGQ